MVLLTSALTLAKLTARPAATPFSSALREILTASEPPPVPIKLRL